MCCLLLFSNKQKINKCTYAESGCTAIPRQRMETSMTSGIANDPFSSDTKRPSMNSVVQYNFLQHTDANN